MEEPIKSPFLKDAKVIRKSTDAEEMAEAIVDNFAKLLGELERTGKEPDPDTFTNYLAGVTSVLIIIGFGREATEAIVNEIHDIIEGIKKDGCGECDHCKGKKK